MIFRRGVTAGLAQAAHLYQSSIPGISASAAVAALMRTGCVCRLPRVPLRGPKTAHYGSPPECVISHRFGRRLPLFIAGRLVPVGPRLGLAGHRGRHSGDSGLRAGRLGCCRLERRRLHALFTCGTDRAAPAAPDTLPVTSQRCDPVPVARSCRMPVWSGYRQPRGGMGWLLALASRNLNAH